MVIALPVNVVFCTVIAPVVAVQPAGSKGAKVVSTTTGITGPLFRTRTSAEIMKATPAIALAGELTMTPTTCTSAPGGGVGVAVSVGAGSAVAVAVGVAVPVGVGDAVAVGVGDAVAVGVVVGVSLGASVGVSVGVGSTGGSVVGVGVGSAPGVGVSTMSAQPRCSCFSCPCAECSFACEAPFSESAFGHPPLLAREPPVPTTAAASRLATRTTRTGVDLFIFSHSSRHVIGRGACHARPARLEAVQTRCSPKIRPWGLDNTRCREYADMCIDGELRRCQG